MNKSETAIICEVEFQEGASPPVGALVPFLSEVARTVHIMEPVGCFDIITNFEIRLSFS